MSDKTNANAKSMSILWVTFTRLKVDLTYMSILNILNSLSEHGHSITLVALRGNNTQNQKYSKIHTTLLPLTDIPLISPVAFTIFLIFYLPLIIAMSDFDFVIMDPYVHIMSAFPQLLFSKLKKAKTILDMRSIPVELKGLRGVMFTFWFNLSIQVAKRFFDGMTILTPLMKKEISKSYEIAPSKIGVWSSGVDTELFNAEKHASQGLSLKRELGLSQKFVVFYHGILTATRGTEEAVQSMAIISKKYPSIVLFLLGNGSAIPKLKTIIKKEALEQNVIIHEAVEYQEVPKFISMSDICLVPLPNHRYWRSQSPLKLLEYLSMEKVVILTDMAAHRYIVGDESCGIYIPSNEPMEIVKAIEFAFENRITLEERGKIGREIVNKQYSWSRIAESLENYLRSIEN